MYLGEGRLDDHAAKCIRYLQATKGCREAQEFSDEIREFKRFWYFEKLKKWNQNFVVNFVLVYKYLDHKKFKYINLSRKYQCCCKREKSLVKNILVIPRDANVKAFAFLKNSHFVHSYIKCSGLTKHFRAF